MVSLSYSGGRSLFNSANSITVLMQQDQYLLNSSLTVLSILTESSKWYYCYNVKYILKIKLDAKKAHLCCILFYEGKWGQIVPILTKKSWEREKKLHSPQTQRLDSVQRWDKLQKRRSKLDIFPYEKWSYATDFKESYFDAQNERGRKFIVNLIQSYRITILAPIMDALE